ncbi:TetR/AcrR family transcriptional regulator [Natronohydrobacter thiooxidans]|uniref:TetR/AcrR family transcriptional regulator n=1 Tax=Natronohydrobacter thiooxidans TaxID=87172 RepID=UPI000A009B11|nr:TetR/AcrR family transcriptional regulator [Natronohydrobacter thiooxidans]
MPKLSQKEMEARRREIIAAAGRCFARKGIQATTMREIFAEAGMSAGAVYNYFKTKDDLIAAGIRDSTDENVAALRGATDAEGRALGFRDLVEMFLFDLDASRRDGRARSTPMIHAEVAVKPELLKMFQEGRQNIRIAAREKVLQMRPELTEAQAATLVDFVFLLYQGMVTEAALDEPTNIDGMREVIDLVLRRYPEG